MREFDPCSVDERSFSWPGGTFDTGRRPRTPSVEGVIHTSRYLLLVTLDGGTQHSEIDTACGHRYRGNDRPGVVSFVPADCERRVKLKGVRYNWASIALSPDFLHGVLADEDRGSVPDFAPFTNVDDLFIAGATRELERLLTADGRLDMAYCQVMSRALVCYIARRYGQRRARYLESGPWKLPPWKLRRLADYVEAHLDQEILVTELAHVAGVSTGHLHRAFHAATGVTPLEYITRKRIERATAIIANESVTVAELALRVGFVSPSHFTRTFRRITGVNPSQFRNGIAKR